MRENQKNRCNNTNILLNITQHHSSIKIKAKKSGYQRVSRSFDTVFKRHVIKRICINLFRALFSLFVLLFIVSWYTRKLFGFYIKKKIDLFSMERKEKRAEDDHFLCFFLFVVTVGWFLLAIIVSNYFVIINFSQSFCRYVSLSLLEMLCK